MADKYQFLAGFIPFHRHARGIVVLDAGVHANKKRLTVGYARAMELIDARVPHFRRDKDFLGSRPLVFMQAKIGSRPKGFLLALVILLGLPRHARFMVPVGEDPGFTIAEDR